MKEDRYHPDEEEMDAIRKEAIEFAGIGLYRCKLDGTILFMDRGALKILDLDERFPDPALVAGMNIANLFEDSDPESLIRDELLRHKRLRGFEYPFRTLTGKDRWALHDSYLVYDGKIGEEVIQVVLRDITHWKNIEKALLEAEAKYRSLVEESLMGVYIIQDDRFVYVNPRLAEIFGYERDELVGGKAVMDLVAPEDRGMVAENIRKRLSGEVRSMHYVLKGLRKDGHVIDAEVYGTSTIYNDRPAVIGSLLDVTERRIAAEKRHEMEEHTKEFYRRTISAATEGKLVICERSEIDEMAGPELESWKLSDPRELGSIRRAVGKKAAELGMDGSRIPDLVLCTGEATTNALKHAGGGNVSLHEVPGALIVKVSDQGPGIEALTIPEATLMKGYSTAGSLGMGYKAIISLADRAYLATGPLGTTIAVEMKLRAPEGVPITAGLPDVWQSGD